MGDTAPENWLGQNGFDPIQCPHCDEVTTPNLLSDGSYICSCTAERALPLSAARGPPWDGAALVMPAPMDDTSFMSAGGKEHAAPPGEHGAAGAERKPAKSVTLPGKMARFGRDISTEEYEPLNDAAAEAGRRDR